MAESSSGLGADHSYNYYPRGPEYALALVKLFRLNSEQLVERGERRQRRSCTTKGWGEIYVEDGYWRDDRLPAGEGLQGPPRQRGRRPGGGGPARRPGDGAPAPLAAGRAHPLRARRSPRRGAPDGHQHAQPHGEGRTFGALPRSRRRPVHEGVPDRQRPGAARAGRAALGDGRRARFRGGLVRRENITAQFAEQAPR